MKRCTFAIAWLLLGATLVSADWKEPADGKLTEKQVTEYIATTKELNSMLKAAGKAMEGSSGAAGLAAAMKANEKYKAIITKHGFTEDEYMWVGGKVWEAWPTVMLQKQWEEQSKPDLEKSMKKNADDQTAATQKLADLEAAQKAGKRYLTKEQREERIKNATDDRNGIKDELKGKDDEIKQIETDAAAKDKEAADAEKLAKNPPAEVAQDDRPGYIEGKNNEATAARDAAKDARNNLAEKKKEKDEITKRLAAAEKRISNPEELSAEEKDDVKKQQDEAIASAKSELDQLKQAGDFLKETLASGQKQLTEMAGNVNPANIELFKKHSAEWEEAMGIGKK